jgi:hypothetical protein
MLWKAACVTVVVGYTVLLVGIYSAGYVIQMFQSPRRPL